MRSAFLGLVWADSTLWVDLRMDDEDDEFYDASSGEEDDHNGGDGEGGGGGGDVQHTTRAPASNDVVNSDIAQSTTFPTHADTTAARVEGVLGGVGSAHPDEVAPGQINNINDDNDVNLAASSVPPSAGSNAVEDALLMSSQAFVKVPHADDGGDDTRSTRLADASSEPPSLASNAAAVDGSSTANAQDEVTTKGIPVSSYPTEVSANAEIARSSSPSPPPRPPTPTTTHVPRHGGGGGGGAAAASSSGGASMWSRVGGAVFGVAGSVTSRVGGVADSVRSTALDAASSVAKKRESVTSVVADAVMQRVDAVKVRAAESVASLRGPRPTPVDDPVSAAVLTASYPSNALRKPSNEASTEVPPGGVTATYPTHSAARPKPEAMYPTVGAMRSDAEKLERLYPTTGTAAGSEERLLTLLLELPEHNRVPPNLVSPPAECTVDDMVFASSQPVRVLGLDFTDEDVNPAPHAVRAVELLSADKYLLCDPDIAAVFQSDGGPLWITVRSAHYRFLCHDSVLFV